MSDRAEKAAPGLKINVYAVRNDFFGENITVAGLLTGKDMLMQLKDKELGERLFLPAATLRSERDLFLDGMTPDQLSQELNVPIEFIDNDGEEFLRAVIG